MSSRENILERIERSLSGGDAAAILPPVPPVWPRETVDAAAMAERFTCELREVHGEVLHCGSMEEARRKLASLRDELVAESIRGKEETCPSQQQSPCIGAADRPLCRELAAGLDAPQLAWAEAEWRPEFMARLPAGLVAADYLLADTGSAVVTCATQQERLLCYLPPLCIVAARTEQLHQHMPAAWDTIVGRCADTQLRGELLIVTGPSRTADIEKILILGAHGPKRLVVILVG